MPETATLTLRDAIEVAGAPCREFTLREPTGSDLRGVMLSSLLQGSTAAFATLIPRIATPALSPAQVERLPLVDQVAILAALTGFFAPGSDGRDGT